jgi:DNA-binding transcriptional MocR family regulator
LYDNAYAVHALTSDAPALGNIKDYALAAETEDHLIQFGSTSKITFAGAGIAFLASSSTVLTALKHHLSFQTIGPDKVNQLRHVRMFDSFGTLQDHMQKHASLLQPKFDAVISTLSQSLEGTGMGSWTHPKGGYFISFETLPGLAQRVVALAADAGVKLTPAGATFPYGKDPNDSNIRIAPSFPNINDVQAAVDAFVICVKLATFRHLANQASNRTV